MELELGERVVTTELDCSDIQDAIAQYIKSEFKLGFDAHVDVDVFSDSNGMIRATTRIYDYNKHNKQSEE